MPILPAPKTFHRSVRLVVPGFGCVTLSLLEKSPRTEPTNGIPYCVPSYLPFSANLSRKSLCVWLESTSSAGSRRSSAAKLAYASRFRMSGAWFVETSVVIFWLMSVQLTIWSLTLAPGFAFSKPLMTSRHQPSVLSEYSGASSEISPSTFPDELPEELSSPPQAANASEQTATATAAASDVVLRMATSPLAIEALRFTHSRWVCASRPRVRNDRAENNIQSARS